MDKNQPLLIMKEVTILDDNTIANDNLNTAREDAFTDLKYQLPIFFVLLTILLTLSIVYCLMNRRSFLSRYGIEKDSKVSKNENHKAEVKIDMNERDIAEKNKNEGGRVNQSFQDTETVFVISEACNTNEVYISYPLYI